MSKRLFVFFILIALTFLEGCNQPQETRKINRPNENKIVNRNTNRPYKEEILIAKANNSKYLDDDKDVFNIENTNLGNLSFQATLYFGSSISENLKRETRKITYHENANLEDKLVEELLKGPMDPSNFNLFPKYTKLINSYSKNKICYLNFNSNFNNGANLGSAGEMFLLFSIVNTLTELPYIEKVQFLVEGNILEDYSHMDISEPIGRNETIID